MKDVFLHFPPIDKPVMIMGKGPSLQDVPSDFYRIGINEVGTKVETDCTFLIHSEHIENALSAGGDLIMPYYPHVGKGPGPLSEDRSAYHYNLSTAPRVNSNTPLIEQDGFTIHALLNVLGLLGIKDITTVGVDGGTEYSQIMGKPHPKTILKYDLQFPYIDKLISKYGFNFKNLGKEIRQVAGHRGMASVNE